MDVKIYIPSSALQEYVLNISTVNAILPKGIKEVTTPYPPTPFQSLLFYCNDPVHMANAKDGLFKNSPSQC